jgi:hypothetical protein
MASILLVLIDIRCPPLHLPPSLIEYVLSFQPRKEVILVLTKCDLVPKDVKDGWESWCKREWGDKYGWDIVAVESYKREARKQGRRRSTCLFHAALERLLSSRSVDDLTSRLSLVRLKVLAPSSNPISPPVNSPPSSPPSRTPINAFSRLLHPSPKTRNGSRSGGLESGPTSTGMD